MTKTLIKQLAAGGLAVVALAGGALAASAAADGGPGNTP
ncbi:MAG: hypothetical protein QOH84_6581, partial [Kribbellaceae bacterium]|nr:hypothetical protein [Kribbellaceae bacterium]